MHVKTLHATLFIISVFPVSACDFSIPKDYSPLLSFTFVLESSSATGDPAGNFCYADLNQQITFNLDGARHNELAVDFKYTYTAINGYYTRILYPMIKGYFPELDNVAETVFGNADSAFITDLQFDEIRTAGDIVRLFTYGAFHQSWGTYAVISDGPKDIMKRNIFAITTNNGNKKGFLRIQPYEQKPAANSKARIAINVKIQP